MSPERQYRELLLKVQREGSEKPSRAGDIISIFNTTWNSGTLLTEGKFPLINCRKINWRGALVELFWILGILQRQKPIGAAEYIGFIDRNNVKYLQREGVNYWNPWADENGDLGPVYGAMLMEWPKYRHVDCVEHAWVGDIDQIQNIIDTLRTNPNDRRMVASMWNPAEIDKMALPPCHYAMQFYSEPQKDGKPKLHLSWSQRSVDCPVGLPFDICLYSFLNVMIAKMTNHIPGTVYANLGDTHIYKNQLDTVETMLKAEEYAPATLRYIGPEYVENLTDFTLDMFEIVDYSHASSLKMTINV